MGYRVNNESSSMSIDFSDLIYRCNMFIMENDSNGNNPASYDLIDYMERILAPFKDPKYKEDLQAMESIEKPRGRTANEQAVLKARYLKKIMDMKHEALMCLAFRNGFLGNKKTQTETGIMGAKDEQVL